jgi:hypothetical protein
VPAFEDLVQDALTTVRLVPRWDLEADDWSAVEDGLARLSRAVAERDGPALRRALEDIEAHGPTRLAAITRSPVGSVERREPPPAVLDIVNTLVHPSAGWTGSSTTGSRSPGSAT